MFKIKINKLWFYKKSIYKNKFFFKIYKKQKIITPNLFKKFYIYNGNFFIKRHFNEFFICRFNKFNIFFKKPLVKPSKKVKKK